MDFEAADMDWGWDFEEAAENSYMGLGQRVGGALRTLELPASAVNSRAAVKLAYRRLALDAHPDRPKGDATRFQAVHAAYELLCAAMEAPPPQPSHAQPSQGPAATTPTAQALSGSHGAGHGDDAGCDGSSSGRGRGGSKL